MNVLAYLSGIFTLITLFLPSSFKLYTAIGAALCGIISTVLFHQPLIKDALDSFFTKFFSVCVAAITVIVAPSISNGIIGNLTLLDPKKFPEASSALSAVIVACIWALIVYLTLMAAVWVQAMHAYRASASPRFRKRISDYLNSKVLAAGGRIAGLCVLLFYLTPLAMNYTSADMGSQLDRLLLSTSFMDNVEQFSFYSVSPDRPPPPWRCNEAAITAGVDRTRSYVCKIQTRHCANAPDRAKVAYYSDKEVVVATELDKRDPLFELVPVRFELQQCDATKRYVIAVSQRRAEPEQPRAGTPTP